jgi:hypothetical protein
MVMDILERLYDKLDSLYAKLGKEKEKEEKKYSDDEQYE